MPKHGKNFKNAIGYSFRFYCTALRGPQGGGKVPTLRLTFAHLHPSGLIPHM